MTYLYRPGARPFALHQPHLGRVSADGPWATDGRGARET